jgi:hypothetical protein
MSPLSDNRRASRVVLRLHATVERVATRLLPGETRECRAEVDDVSLTGISLVVDERFDRDAHVRVTIRLTEQSGLAAIGPRWVSEGSVRSCAAVDAGTFKVGIQLHERNGRELEGWQELLTKWSPKIL